MHATEKGKKRRKLPEEKEKKEAGGQMFCVITKVYLADGEAKDDPKCELKGKMQFVPADKNEPNVVHCTDSKAEERREPGEKGIEEKGSKAAADEAAKGEGYRKDAGWRATYVGFYP